jgi:hypothetical protein
MNKTTSMNGAIQTVKRMMYDCAQSGEPPGTFDFVSAQVILDLQEIICQKGEGIDTKEVYAFDIIPMGYGSKEGFSIHVAGDDEMEEEEKTSKEEGKVAGRQQRRIRKAFTDMKQYIASLDNKKLQSLGLVKKTDGVLVVWLNGREFGFADCEHMYCKIYVLVSTSRGTRYSNSPFPYRRHCHPFTDKSIMKGEHKIQRTFLDAIKAFEELVEKGDISYKIPPPFEVPADDRNAIEEEQDDVAH